MAAIRKGDLFAATGYGATLNFPWEMAQSALYRIGPESPFIQRIAYCGFASLADGAGIAAMFALGAFAFRDPRWTRLQSPARWGFIVLLGFIGAGVTEWVALGQGWWSYRPAMPRLPGTELGASPLAQFVILPPVVLFWALPRWRWQESRRQR